MVDVVEQLEGYVFSAADLSEITDWPQILVDDYLSSNRNTLTVATAVDAIDSDTDDLEAAVAINTANIVTNTTDISTNADDIATLFLIVNTQYQCFKLGTQATTSSYVELTGWSEDKSFGGFTLDSVNGTIEFLVTGKYVVSAWVLIDNSSASGTQLNTKLQVDKGGGFVDLQAAEDRQYSSSGATLNAGSAQINSYQLNVSASDLIRVQVQDNGAPGDINTDYARINIQRIA